MPRPSAAAALVLLAAAIALARPQAQEPVRMPAEVPIGRFGLTRLATQHGGAASPYDFGANTECAVCHAAQWRELNGSMHSVAHHDPLYRAFAELARKEAGEEVYRYCSGCHSPAGVAMDFVPAIAEGSLPEIAKAGVTCDVCHRVSALTGPDGPWGEPGNASLVLRTDLAVKLGPSAEVTDKAEHGGEAREYFQRSEYCASCHTIIHPTNGLRIEHTYDEWRRSAYAEHGIQCQDCHMRSLEDAREVARTLRPVPRPVGLWAHMGRERPRSVHEFVGGNVDAGTLSGSARHGALAEARLQSAATLAIERHALSAERLRFEVVVTNVGAGHDLPTSLTELRRLWVHLRVTDAAGALVFESGALDEAGEIPRDAIQFGAETIDADGRVTFKPWEAVGFAWRRTIPPKGAARDEVDFALPSGSRGPYRIVAELFYRTAPPHVLREVMGAAAFEPRRALVASVAAEVGGG